MTTIFNLNQAFTAMKKLIFFFVILLGGAVAYGQALKPYILGATYNGSMSEAKAKAKDKLTAAGFKVVGEYSPVNDPARWVFAVSHPELDKAVQAVGDLTGFAAVLRVALTKEGNVINASYTNPYYWGNAYFRDDFDKVKANYDKLAAAFEKGVGSMNKGFGSEEGIEPDDLHDYHYMFGMPYFDDTKELGEFASHEAAVAHIDAALKAGKPGVKLVYKYKVPGTKLTLYGLALSGEKGEENFMPKIDIASPKHTAFLPYEMLVKGNEVHMLHGRFRIALSFPDLTMGTFTKIMSTPGDIQDLLKQLVE